MEQEEKDERELTVRTRVNNITKVLTSRLNELRLLMCKCDEDCLILDKYMLELKELGVFDAIPEELKQRAIKLLGWSSNV